MNNETLPTHINKFRLGVYTAEYHQPISLMRVLGPLQAMAKEDPRLELVLPPLTLGNATANEPGGQMLGWNWLNGLDGVFYLHPETDTQVHSIALARSLHVPVWAEYVDDIFNVDPANPNWKQRRNKNEQRINVGLVAQSARCLTTVSEQNRKAILDGLDIPDEKMALMIRQKTIVLPEACMWDAQTEKRQKVVSWRGLGSHAGDIDHALPHILEVARRFQDWKWLFCGDPEIVQELGQQVSKVTEAGNVMMMPMFPTPFDMMQAWGGCAPYLHIVPLADTPFNRSKSHLAWLEASAVGAGVIAPDHLMEWKQPGVIHYHDWTLAGSEDSSLTERLANEMIKFDEGKLHPNVKIAREAIYPAKTLPEFNRVRWGILRKMCRPQNETDRKIIFN